VSERKLWEQALLLHLLWVAKRDDIPLTAIFMDT